MWLVYLDFNKRGGCSYSDKMYIPRMAIYVESLVVNKLKNRWLE